MDLEHALEIAEESRAGGYDSPTELALQFLADYVRRADRKAREECAEIARAHASCEGIAESIEYEIRNTMPE